MKTLLIDNYDSFTFNLYQYLAEINGEPPLVVRNDAMSWAEAAALGCDNIVISPGPGRPERERDFGFCRQALLQAEVPVLGICLGHQGLGHVFGAKVRTAPQPMHGRLSSIAHDGTGVFRGLPSPFLAVRYHSLILDPDLPDCLRATAWTPDGTLMGLNHRSRPLWGVQFHPESIGTEHGRALLENFRDLTVETGPKRPVRIASAPPPPKRATVVGRMRLRAAHRRLGRWIEPETAFAACFAGSDAAFLFASGAVRSGRARFTFAGDASSPASAALSYRSVDRRWTIVRDGSSSRVDCGLFDHLAGELARWEVAESDLPFDFLGGFVGYFGYELKQECGASAAHASASPDAQFLFADRFLAFDRAERTVTLVALEGEGFGSAEAWFEAMERRLPRKGAAPAPRRGTQAEPVVFRLRHDRAAYLARIGEALREIAAGESYQVCLTNELRAAVSGVDGFAFYRALQETNPVPAPAYFKFPGLEIASSSPETFLRFRADGRVEARPIKGTARRSPRPEEDAEIARRLGRDEKNRSENLMIADLLRNDLGRFCRVGSVGAPRLMEVERYATVHQLVSTIEGLRTADSSVLDGIRAAFPAGSMTGAPKLRTMEIIDRLEGGARGVYSGAMGYLSLGGAADLSVVIRTIVVAGGEVSIGAGGAVVALSDPAAEFEEMLLKAEAPMRAVARALRGDAPGTPFVVDGIEAPGEKAAAP